MEKLLTKKEIMDMLGIKESTIYAWTCQNKIPHVKLSARSLRFKESDILAWLAKKTFRPSEQLPISDRYPKKRKKHYQAQSSISDDYVERIIKNAKENVFSNK